MLIYLLSLPIWNFVLPTYAYWKFDDFSWGDTRKTAGEKTKKAGLEYEGEFDSSKITMKKWADFEHERRLRAANASAGSAPSPYAQQPWAATGNGNGGRLGSMTGASYDGHGNPAFARNGMRTQSNLGMESTYDY